MIHNANRNESERGDVEVINGETHEVTDGGSLKWVIS